MLFPVRDVCSGLHSRYIIPELMFHRVGIHEIPLDDIDNGTTYDDAIGPGCSTCPRVVRWRYQSPEPAGDPCVSVPCGGD